MFLIEQLAKAANMSSRFVIKYRTMHHRKGWCGNWIAAFLSDFVNSTDEEWEANYKELREWWKNYSDPSSEFSVEMQLRMIVRSKLARTGKLSPLYSKLLERSYFARYENKKLCQGRRRRTIKIVES